MREHLHKIKHHVKKQLALRNVLIVILAITLPFVILLDNTKQAMFYEGYDDILEETARVENFSQINQNILSFFVFSDDLEGFTAREVSHMEDVRWLVQNGYNTYRILILVAFIAFFVLITRYTIQDAAYALFIASIVSIVKLSLLGLVNFGVAFDVFHRLFFEEGTWLFNQFDLLIRMYSFEFFQTISRRIIVNTGIQAAVLGFFGFMLRHTDLKRRF